MPTILAKKLSVFPQGEVILEDEMKLSESAGGKGLTLIPRETYKTPVHIDVEFGQVVVRQLAKESSLDAEGFDPSGDYLFRVVPETSQLHLFQEEAVWTFEFSQLIKF